MMRGQLTWAGVAVLAVCGAAGAQIQATIDLTGVRLQNGLNQSRTSEPQTVNAARRYRYQVSGMVRGTSGLLALLYPNPIALEDLLESVEPGSSAILAGYGCNWGGGSSPTHPVTFLDEEMGGETKIGGITATLSLRMRAGVTAQNFAFFEMTDVVVTPSIIGSMTFTSGFVAVRREACPADFNDDGVINLADFGSFQTTFAVGDLRADLNCDRNLNLADFGTFQTAHALGCE